MRQVFPASLVCQEAKLSFRSCKLIKKTPRGESKLRIPSPELREHFHAIIDNPVVWTASQPSTFPQDIHPTICVKLNHPNFQKAGK